MLDRFPSEILEEIVSYVVIPVALPQHAFVTNSVSIGWQLGVALSLVLSRLRAVVGPIIFRYLSLVRLNEIDSFLQVPLEGELYSHRDYDKKFLQDVYQRNLERCRKSDGGKSKSGVAGKCRYESFSYNLAVRTLECDKLVPLELFPNITLLKLYFHVSLSLPLKLDNLYYLAATMHNAMDIDAPNLYRLDVLSHFDEIDPAKFGLWNVPPVSELNVYVDHSFVWQYKKVLQWLRKFNLKKFGSRKSTRKRDDPETMAFWEIEANAGDVFCNLLTGCQEITLDIQIIDGLSFSGKPVPYVGVSYLCLVDQCLTGPKLSQSLTLNLAILASSWLVGELLLQFGEVVDNSDLGALTVLNCLLTEFVKYHQGLLVVSVEKCWSRLDEIKLRHHWVLTSLNLSLATVWGRLDQNTPRYRKQEVFMVDYEKGSFMLTPKDTTASNWRFWSISAALQDLEQYTLPPRKKSGIWD